MMKHIFLFIYIYIHILFLLQNPTYVESGAASFFLGNSPSGVDPSDVDGDIGAQLEPIYATPRRQHDDNTTIDSSGRN